MSTNTATLYELQDELYDRGLSLTGFARLYGFDPATVHRAIHEYWGTDRIPRGVVSRRILRKLNEVLSQPPELTASAN
jgi:hypothetical protein